MTDHPYSWYRRSITPIIHTRQQLPSAESTTLSRDYWRLPPCGVYQHGFPLIPSPIDIHIFLLLSITDYECSVKTSLEDSVLLSSCCLSVGEIEFSETAHASL